MRGMAKPGLCFISPMVGKHAGYIPTQGQLLAEHFAAAGYRVMAASAALRRTTRLAEMLGTAWRAREQAEVLVVDVYGELSFIGEDLVSWLGRRLGMKVILHLHNGTLPDFMRRHPAWTRRVLGRAHALVTPSAFLQRAIAPLGFQAQVIPNVIDVERYPFRLRREAGPRLFWMRTFYPYYNPLMAVRVLARLLPEYPQARLVMAGKDKGMLGEVQAFVREQGLEEQVSFPGFLGLEGKIREGEAADIFLNTNQVDNMPVGVIEAGAMGLPIVATRVGGIPDMLVDEETGLLVPDGDDEAMAAAVRRLIETPELAEKLSRNGRVLAERSAWPEGRRQWEALFARLLERAA